MPLFGPELDAKLIKARISPEMRGRMYRELTVLMDNGVPMDKALSKMYQVASAEGKNPNAPKAVMLYEISHLVANGKKFSFAIQKWAPKLEHALIVAGEEAGDLRGAFAHAMKLVEARRRIWKAVAMKVPYPLFLFGMTGYLLTTIGKEQVPAMLTIAPESAWTGAAGLLIKMATFTNNFGWAIVASVLAATIAIVVSLPRLKGDLRITLDRFGPWRAYRSLVGANILLAFGTLVHRGVKQEAALELLNANTTPYLRERLDGALNGIRIGKNFGQSLRLASFEFPDKEAIAYVELLCELDGFAKALLNYADEWLDLTLDRITRFLNVFFYAGILSVVLIGGVVVTSQNQLTQVAKQARH